MTDYYQLTDYYQRMREACARIVENSGNAGNLHDLLEMAKWVAMDRDEAMEAYKEALEKAMKEGVAEAMLKAIEEEMAQA